MPAIVIPDTFELSIHGDVHANEVVAVLHYFRTGGVTASEAQSAATAFRDNVLTSYLNCLSANYTARKIVCKNLHTAGGPVYELPLVGSYIGARGGAVMPANVAVALSWRTSSATRSGRGRTYLGPLAEPDCNGDFINPALSGLIATFGSAVINTLLIPGAKVGVASRIHSLTQIILSFVLDAVLDSMRRRLTGRGR